jgi:hypothetical protein
VTLRAGLAYRVAMADPRELAEVLDDEAYYDALDKDLAEILDKDL